jgi:hypothetical protein
VVAGTGKIAGGSITLPRLSEADPGAGVTILYDGREWRVTGQATYSTEEGYRVREWCCEVGDSTAYLLKEGDPKGGTIRWFFTREIDASAVAFDGGRRLAESFARGAEERPPDTLTYQGTAYHYADSTDGMHEDESGKRVRKVTWDYWDAGHEKNLAIERWPDGSFDCYLGSYIEPGQVTIRPAGRRGFHKRSQANPFLSGLLFLPIVYFIAFVIGWPFDESLGLALPIAAVMGWLAALPSAPVACMAALAAVPLGAAVFWHFPPLTSVSGLVAVVAIPLAVGWLAQKRGYSGRKPAALYPAAFALAAPLLGLGFYYYFNLAPGPHTPDQLFLALGPAAIGGLAGVLIAGLVLRKEK